MTPEENEAMLEFIYAPDTVDFVVRRSEYFDTFVEENPQVLVTQTLAGRYAVCYATEEDFEKLIKYFGSTFISTASIVLGPLDRSALEASGIFQVQQQPYLDLRGSGVLLGIVDSGIDYTLDTFRYEDGSTKIRYLYDQSIQGIPPKGFYLGSEYTAEQIDEALASEDPKAIVPQTDEIGHGTFMASVAAGREVGDFVGAAPDAEIVAVKLRKARPFYLERFSVPEEQEAAYESTAVMVGVEYLVTKAREMNRPIVICIGLGTNTGSHSGFSVLEEYLNGVATLKSICLCTAAGNEAQARHHTDGKILDSGETAEIDIRMDESESDVFLTLWNGVADRVSVSIRSPTGELVSRVPAKPGAVMTTDLVLEDSSVRVEYYFPLEGTSGQLTVIKLIKATPGIWTITVYGDIILDGTFHAWLPITGFVSPGVEFLAATPNFTVTIPATMNGSISNGAYDHRKGSLYPKSSWGPTRSCIMAPDLVAPGVEVGGFYPFGYGTMNGTSAAAAITAGACALMMEWAVVKGNEPTVSTYQVRAYLIRGCGRSDTMSYPNPQWGYGTLDLMETFNMMREI